MNEPYDGDADFLTPLKPESPLDAYVQAGVEVNALAQMGEDGEPVEVPFILVSYGVYEETDCEHGGHVRPVYDEPWGLN